MKLQAYGSNTACCQHSIVFPNGNGRHSRLMADIIADKIFRQPPFSWGAGNIANEDIRAAYQKALRLADRGDYGSLLAFARS